MKQTTDINIIGVSEDSFKLDEKALGNESTLNTNLGVQFQYNAANRIFKTSVIASLYKPGTSKHPVLQTSASMMFEISEMEIEKFSVDNELILPTEFQNQTAQLTIGIIRGIIVSHMTQASLTPVIIPILDLAELNVKPMILKLD